MFTKTILSILFISIAQTSWARPNPKEDLCLIKSKYAEYLAPSENHNSLPPSGQLLMFGFIDLEKMAQKYVQGGKVVCDQLLKNDEIINSKSVKVLEFKKKLTKFEEDYGKCVGLHALLHLVASYSSTTSFYFDQDEATFDADSKFILSLLRKYKADDLDREFQKSSSVFVDDFYKKFESLKGDLVKKEGKFSKQIADLFANFKTLKSYDDKIETIDQFDHIL